MSKTDYPVTQCHSLEEQNVEPHCCENLWTQFSSCLQSQCWGFCSAWLTKHWKIGFNL